MTGLLFYLLMFLGTCVFGWMVRSDTEAMLLEREEARK